MLARALLLGALCLASAASAAVGAETVDTAALLTRYEPVVEQYRADWKPSPVEPYLAAADLERLTFGLWRLVRHSPPASALAGGPSTLRLDTRGCSPAVDLDSCYPRRPTQATVYGRVWTSTSATVLQYWFFYPLDDWHNSLTKPLLWHMHEGDWEEVSVELGPAELPIAVAASQHDEGVQRSWARVKVADGTHPMVYIALGSHANYFSPGYKGVAGVPHRIPRRFSGLPLLEPDFTSTQRSLGPPGTAAGTLAVVDIADGKAPWLSFAGAWGDGEYVLLGAQTDNGVVYTHLPVGSSPSGPAFHDIWRSPLLQFRTWPADDGH
jgi:hypothetical protein